MTGGWLPIDSGGNQTTIALATGIKFTGSTFLTTTATGDYAALNGSTGVIHDFQFSPSTPVTPLWSNGIYSFDLTYLVYNKETTSGSDRLDVYGYGFVSNDNFTTSTPSYWNFTGQGAQNDNFSWSASAGSPATAPTPEPATMLLLGTGLAGLAGVVKRKKRKELA